MNNKVEFMNKQIYTYQKTYEKFDAEHFVLYLNEEIVVDYVPEVRGNEETPEPCVGYSYTGNMPDGGTLIEAKGATYNEFVSGLIRVKYSADEVEAITLNKLSSNQERRVEFDAEFSALEDYRNLCKEQVRNFF